MRFTNPYYLNHMAFFPAVKRVRRGNYIPDVEMAVTLLNSNHESGLGESINLSKGESVLYTAKRELDRSRNRDPEISGGQAACDRFTDKTKTILRMLPERGRRPSLPLSTKCVQYDKSTLVGWAFCLADSVYTR